MRQRHQYHSFQFVVFSFYSEKIIIWVDDSFFGKIRKDFKIYLKSFDVKIEIEYEYEIILKTAMIEKCEFDCIDFRFMTKIN